ncbi:MAG: sigma-70 family RNA polymerase sigma factor [Verrucomicrobia bacterium]|nr:MAG: sigma-70 family RNA polymerase sigma factor [Verrucomicrobiota bacterium]
MAQAGQTADPERRREALDRLLQAYRKPLVEHVIWRFQCPRADAEDRVQVFLEERVFQANIVGQADQSRGRFRDFLRTALDRHVLNYFRWKQAQRRGGNGKPKPLDACEFELSAKGIPGDSDPLDCDLEWARAIFREAARRMRHECVRSGNLEMWAVFEGRILRPLLEAKPPVDYAELADQLGIKDLQRVRLLLKSAKRKFVRILKALLEALPAADEEWQTLKDVLPQALRTWLEEDDEPEDAEAENDGAEDDHPEDDRPEDDEDEGG